MRDSGQVIRKAFFTALNGNVNYQGEIPVVDEKLDQSINEHDLYILIGDQQETAADTKSYWAREILLGIAIVNRRKSTATKTIIENIADQILQILYPSRLTYGFTLESPFKLSYSRLDPANYNFTPVDSGFEISKQLTFKTRITQ